MSSIRETLLERRTRELAAGLLTQHPGAIVSGDLVECVFRDNAEHCPSYRPGSLPELVVVGVFESVDDDNGFERSWAQGINLWITEPLGEYGVTSTLKTYPLPKRIRKVK